MKIYQVSENDLKYFIECRAVDNWSWYGESISTYLEDYFSDNDSEWWDNNSPDFSMIADREIQHYKEVEVNAK